MVIGEPLAYLFRWLAIAAPVLIIAYWPRPPLIVGLFAVFWGLGAIVNLFTQGVAGRWLVVASRTDRSGVLRQHGWAAVVRSLLATVWLAPVIGVWSAAFENRMTPEQAATAADYTGFAFWYLADILPFFKVAEMLGFPEPPLETWSLVTSLSLLLLGAVFAYAIVLVVTELLRRT